MYNTTNGRTIIILTWKGISDHVNWTTQYRTIASERVVLLVPVLLPGKQTLFIAKQGNHITTTSNPKWGVVTWSWVFTWLMV